MKIKAMSYKPEVQTDSSGKWYSNALRFATRKEAEEQVKDLMMRWMLVRDTQVVESLDPATHTYINGELGSIK